MPFDFKSLTGQELFEPIDTPPRLFQAKLRLPLKRRVGFGNKGRHADVHLDLPTFALPTAVADLFCQIDNRLDIVLGFRWQPHHEIQFDQFPAQGKSVPAGCQEVLFGNSLIDDTAQAISPCFRGNGESGFSDTFDLLHDFRCQSSDSHGRHGHGNILVGKTIHEFRHQCPQAGVITGGQRQQRQFLETADVDPLLDLGNNLGKSALPDRTVGHSGLAKPTTACATTGDFDAKSVMYRFDHRNKWPVPLGKRLQFR